MKHIILMFVILLFVFSCDNRTLDPEDVLWAWLFVYENDVLIHDEVVDETDQAEIILIDDDTSISKFVNFIYSELPSGEDEEIARDYIFLASRGDYFTRFYQCTYQDTVIIDLSGGLSPIPAGKVCGAIFTEDHYSMNNEAFYVLEDTLIVADIATNLYGYFENDSLQVDQYYGIVLQADFPYGDTLSFHVQNFYQDYYFNFDGE